MDAILVTELSGGRSTLDLLNTLRELENWKVSVIAMMNGVRSSPYGRMLATFLSGIAEFERSSASGSSQALLLRHVVEAVVRPECDQNQTDLPKVLR
ncbi:recombinase family protein [Enterobacter hormaechei]|uniref:recombinase family protein n=1 Tax=Enterobacter hormaechei TaxID=158836 RepID=UPI003890C6DB